MTTFVATVLTIAVVVLLVSLLKKQHNEKANTFVCEKCDEHDCICYETDDKEKGGK
jgi:hypothetical protein